MRWQSATPEKEGDYYLRSSQDDAALAHMFLDGDVLWCEYEGEFHELSILCEEPDIEWLGPFSAADLERLGELEALHDAALAEIQDLKARLAEMEKRP